MNEYEILGGLHKIIDDDTNLKMKEWLDSHNVNNYLLYPGHFLKLRTRVLELLYHATTLMLGARDLAAHVG